MDESSLLIYPVLMRMIERIMSVVIGGFAIYFGYRLFLSLPEQAPGSGRFKLPGGTSLYLTRVGPGVFFSLFGTVLVCFALLSPVNVGRNADGEIHVSSMRAQASTEPDLAQRRQQVEAVIGDLNRIPQLLRPDVDSKVRADLEPALRAARLALLRGVWSDDWGAWPAFAHWTLDPGSPPPGEAQVAAKIYSKGRMGTP